MKICLVTAFPPSRKGLSEYGFHIARELQRDPLLSLSVLGDTLESNEPELEDFEVVRCWDYNSLLNPVKLLRQIKACKPDVVWFNLLFSTFGDKPVPAFVGLLTPVLARLSGTYTHITLHHLVENIKFEDAGIRFPRLYNMAGEFATRILLSANSLSVLLPAYRRTLMEKYKRENVHFRAHGILSARPEYPDFAQRNNPEQRIVAFGKWGTYKRLETLIESFAEVHAKNPNARLVVAGGNHPMTPGYVESVAERFKDSPYMKFTGYVAEDDIPQLFRTASVVVMPYLSATGASGVAHLACEYGVPIISADITDFRNMAADEDFAMDFYSVGDAGDLADRLLSLLDDRERQQAMAEQNFAAALRMTMPTIMRQYVRSFDLHRKRKALQPLTRFRRIPSWVPSRSAIFRAAAPRWAPWM